MTERVIEGRTLDADVQFGADVIVVGSGAAGAVAAYELARVGLDVLVLEEGPHRPSAQLGAMRPSESLRAVWREGAMSGVIGIGDTPVINLTMGRCVGGSSVLTGGVCFRTPDAVLDDWRRERGLAGFTPNDMAPFFEEVEARVNVETVPTYMRSRSTVLWAEGAAKLGVQVKPTRRNTRGCDGCGRCNFGCPHGAKMSVDISYLPDAMRCGATVVSDALVDRIEIDGDRVTGVRGRFVGPAGRRLGKFSARANAVVLAAGAAHTPLLLMRSGVGAKSRQVGRNMTLHPGFRLTARFDSPVNGWRGALQSAYTDAFEHERITLISVFVPPGALISGIPGFGPELMARAGRLDHLAMFGGMLHDDGGGRVRRGIGREPLLTYRMSAADRAAMPTLVRRLADGFFAAGAREVYLPILGHPPVTADELRTLDLDEIPARRYECSSQHPLGTCRIGVEPESSVVDPSGRVWGVPNLCIVDGSIVPTSLGVNPQLTIMALATRLARGAGERLRASIARRGTTN